MTARIEALDEAVAQLRYWTDLYIEEAYDRGDDAALAHCRRHMKESVSAVRRASAAVRRERVFVPSIMTRQAP